MRMIIDEGEIEERICFPGRLGDGEGDDWNDVNEQTVFFKGLKL